MTGYTPNVVLLIEPDPASKPLAPPDDAVVVVATEDGLRDATETERAHVQAFFKQATRR